MLGIIFTAIFFIIFIGGGVYFALRQQRKTKTLIASYASEHGWVYNTPTPEIPLFHGNKRDKSLMEGKINNYRFWLYNYWLGNASRLTYPTLTVELPIELPTILLEPQYGAVSTSDMQVKSNLGLEPLQVEGNFNQHFKVYTEDGKGVSTLEYLTPDIMSQIEDNLKSSVLFSGTYLSINAIYAQNKEQLDILIISTQALVNSLQQMISVNSSINPQQ
jgi:hypothetical protein